MQTKEQWISETMGSLDGLTPAESDPLLFDQISAKISTSAGKTVLPGSRMILRIAAGLVLLITLNILSLIYYTHSARSASDKNPLVNEYFSYIKTMNPEP
jgi:hypothetical protein